MNHTFATPPRNPSPLKELAFSTSRDTHEDPFLRSIKSKSRFPISTRSAPSPFKVTTPLKDNVTENGSFDQIDPSSLRIDDTVTKLTRTPIKPLMSSPFKFHKTPRNMMVPPTHPSVNKSITPNASKLNPTRLQNDSIDQLFKKSLFNKRPSKPSKSTLGSKNDFDELASESKRKDRTLSFFKPKGAPAKKLPPNAFNNKALDQKLMPTGDWLNPQVEKAISRMVNKDSQVKKLLTNAMLWAILKLLLSITVIITFNLDFSDKFYEWYEYITYFGHYLWILLQSLFFFNVVTSLFELFKPRDQCLDLNLTPRQRQLLGLEPLNETDLREGTDYPVSNLPKVLPTLQQQQEQPENTSFGTINQSFASMSIDTTKNSTLANISSLGLQKAPSSLNKNVSQGIPKLVSSNKYLYDLNTSFGGETSFY
ncbi:hypothetical protein LJB42_002546 [Komagataella kurtzmanii]|nr:hypothetical protein LJB42_002546 [Komagataella kurtzmanii]